MSILHNAISALHTLELWRSGFERYHAKMEMFLKEGKIAEAMVCKRISLKYKTKSIVEHDRELCFRKK